MFTIQRIGSYLLLCGFFVVVYLEIGYLSVSIAVKRYRDHINSYKGKYLIVVAHLHFRGLISLSLWWEVRQHAGRQGFGKGVEVSSVLTHMQ